MKKTHLCYKGTLEFELCTICNSKDTEMLLKECFLQLNERKDFDGAVGAVKFDKIHLCNQGCLDIEDVEDDEEY